MSLAFNPTDPVPPWRVGVFVSSSRRPQHVVMVAVGDKEIAEYGGHPDFVRWLTPDPHGVLVCGHCQQPREGHGPAKGCPVGWRCAHLTQEQSETMRASLTDEQIDAIAAGMRDKPLVRVPDYFVRAFARQIAAHVSGVSVFDGETK